jgi:hypothetical protein
VTGLLKKLALAVRTPAYATIVTVLAVIAGLLGSVYQNDIAAAFPLTWSGASAGMSWRAVIFWLSVLLFAVLFFLRQQADDQAGQRLEEAATKAEGTTARIEALIQTLPPRAFQTHLAEMYVAAHNAVARVMPKGVREGLAPPDLVAVIQSLLHAIAFLASVYDDQPMTEQGAASYSANIMLFVPQHSLPTDLELLFLPREYDRAQLRGALVLRQDLSSIASDQRIDEAVPSIALPVPEEAERDGRWIALPGAPRAFLRGEVDGYADTQTMAQWAEERGDFLPSVRDALREYFNSGGGRTVKSFISRPIGIGNEGQPLGVLNIHSNHAGLLGPDVEKRLIFQALATPILTELAEALQCLVSLEAGAVHAARE